MVSRCFPLAARTNPIEFSLDRLKDPAENPGWAIAVAWAAVPERAAGACSEASRRVLLDAASRFSFEGPSAA